MKESTKIWCVVTVVSVIVSYALSNNTKEFLGLFGLTHISLYVITLSTKILERHIDE